MLLKHEFFFNCMLFCLMMSSKWKQLSAILYTSQSYSEVADLLMKLALKCGRWTEFWFFVC